MRTNWTLLLICTLFSHSTIAQRTLLHCGKLIDGTSEEVATKMTVIIEGKTIAGVEKGYSKPAAGDKVVDLKEKTVMAGLMDMHVHIEGESSPGTYLRRFTYNDADIALQSTVYAKRTLMAGFTTVRDLGGSGVNVSLRNAINKGLVVGPRIYTVEKAIGTTGGHADPTNGVRDDLKGDPGPKEGVVNSAEDAKKAVRQRYKNGADLIKITATGGVLSVAKDGQGPQFDMEELKAIVSTAKDYGMTTAAHAHGAEGMRRAVLAGITSIEHGTLMTPDIMDLMKEMGTYYVPTISAGKFVAEKAKVKGYFPAVIVPKASSIGPQIVSTFSKAYKAGVKIAFGTDCGVCPHGDNGKEFIYMNEGGMPAIEAILSATVTASQLLGVEDELGTIETGKLADIIAVPGDPRENIETMTNVKFVMKEGVIYKEED